MSTPAPLAADQLVPVVNASHDNRLELVPLLDGLGKLIQRLFIEHLPRISWIRIDLVHGDQQRHRVLGLLDLLPHALLLRPARCHGHAGDSGRGWPTESIISANQPPGAGVGPATAQRWLANAS